MIKNSKQFRQARLDLNRWKQLKNRTFRMVESFFARPMDIQFHDVNKRINILEQEIYEYQRLRYEVIYGAGPGLGPDLNYVDTLGKDLVRIRVAIGWSQSELARRAGISVQQINRYEANFYSKAALERIVFIAQLLNTALEQIKKISH